MIKNYLLKTNFKIAWRRLRKDRLFTFLNMMGLSTGLACALLIYLWVDDERNIGKFNEKDSRLFEVMHNITTAGGGVETIEPTPGLMAKSLQQQFPEIENAVSVIPTALYDKEGILSVKDNFIRTNRILAGKDYFHVFPYRLIAGDKDHVLPDNSSVVISKELALQLFNTTNHDQVVGQTVNWNQMGYSGNYFVSGIFERPPSYAADPFDLIFNYGLFLEKNPVKTANWRNSDASTFLLLKKGASIESLEKKINTFIRSKNNKDDFFLQQFSDKYLHNHYENGKPTGGRIVYVNLFSVIAVFILLIASINFMNLSTAKAAGRAKETGIKKVVGAGRRGLIAQYMGESLLLTFLSLLVAFLLVICLLSPFNNLTGKQLTSPFSLTHVLVLLGIGLFTGIVAGSYPALYLSRFKPIAALTGRLPRSLGELVVRKGLVTFQFVLSIVFIASVMVIYKQLKFIQTKNLGYNRDHIVWFEKGGVVSDSNAYYKEGGGFTVELETFLQGIKNIPGVINATNFRHNITNRHGGTSGLNWEGKDPNKDIDFSDLAAGYDFIETLGIKMVEGRAFSRNYGSEKNKVIFNEAAIETMGLKNPIGKMVTIWGENREIIGVTQNFNFESLHENIRPCFFDFNFSHWSSRIMVRIKAGKETETIAGLQDFYKKNNHGLTLDFRFLDDDYQALYVSEKRVSVLSQYFAGIAILISCLGIFGLAAFTAQRRQKEIGIRKVIGASVNSIVLLLSKDFLKMVGVAILIAFPIAWWAMNQWLRDFAYRIPVNAGIFLVAGTLTLFITLLTISFQSIKAALANPAGSLRAAD